MFKLLRYYLPYRRLIVLALLSNILMSVFTVISIPVLQPFLQILFNRTETEALPENPGPLSFSNFEDHLSIYFAQPNCYTGTRGGLLWVCGACHYFLLGKTCFVTLHVLSRSCTNGVVRDLRKKVGG
ncbi:MAG: hypothetical protein R2792_01290 [Saprospiraceae bacterium]